MKEDRPHMPIINKCELHRLVSTKIDFFATVIKKHASLPDQLLLQD